MYYYFFLDKPEEASSGQSDTLFNHPFFQKVCLSPSLLITDYGFKVLNAVFFKSTDLANFHVYVNELSFSFPKVLYDFWNGTRFLFAKDLFPDKLKDFNGRVLRATSFNFAPYTYQAECSHWSTYFKILCSMYSIVAGGT